MFDALAHDLRHGSRHLLRSPGFTLAALLTLALGIGANMAMFSLLNALVLRPLPIKDPQDLIAISGRNVQGQLQLTPIPAVDELSKPDSPLRDICAHNGNALLSVSANGGATQVIGALVSGGCFETFGVPPILGRTITEEDAPLYRRGNLVTVISHRLWTRMFGGDPAAIGKPIGVEGVELTVIGVMPEGFVGAYADSGIDLYTPYDTWSPARKDRRPAASYFLGRLRSGVTLEQASEQLTAQWPALLQQVVPAAVPAAERQAMVAAKPRVERITRGISSYRDRYARAVTLMFGLTASLLALACLNLGGLLLSRAIERGPEMATRMALGGSRWRLARQSLIENVLLSIAGSVLAIPAALGIITVIVSFLPRASTGRMMSFTPDAFVLTATAIGAIATGLLMSLPALWLAAPSAAAISRSAGRTVTSRRQWTRALLVAEVGLSTVLVIGAALLGRSLYLLSQVDPGVRADGVLIATVQPVPNGYQNVDNTSYYPPMLERLAALPGVRSAAQGRAFPRITGDIAAASESIALVGDEDRGARAMWEITSPAYFETLGIPLLRGRTTSWSDNVNTPRVAVVSERLALSLSPDGNVIGRRVRFGANPLNQDVEIVGVVRSATMGNPRQSDVPVLYRPALQMGRTANFPSFLIRVDDVSAAAVAAAVRQIVAEGRREFVVDVEPLSDVLARAPSTERMSAAVAGMVAGLAAILAFTGVFGLLAYAVTRRTKEIGVRSAIGAEPRAVIWMVMREGVLVTGLGLAIGIPAALFGARLLGGLMFGIAQADPLTFGTVAVFFVALGLAAGIVPARRAARVDPVIALRAE